MRYDLIELVHAHLLSHGAQKLEDHAQLEGLVQVSLLLKELILEVTDDPLGNELLHFSIVISFEMPMQREVDAHTVDGLP